MAVVDARVIIVWATAGGSAINTADVQFDDSTTSYQDAADSIRDALEDNILVTLVNAVSLVEVKVGDDVIGAIATSGTSGSSTDASTNPSVAFGFTKEVSSGRNGRWFVPGVSENLIDGAGRISAGGVNALNGLLAGFIADITADGVTMTVRQKVGAPVPVTQMSCRNFITLQSRRLDRARGF